MYSKHTVRVGDVVCHIVLLYSVDWTKAGISFIFLTVNLFRNCSLAKFEVLLAIYILLFMKFVTCNMLLGSEQVYVTIKLFNSYYSIFLTCTSFHSPIETLSNMLIVATKKKRSDKIIYEIYNKSCSGFDKYWLKNRVLKKTL